MDHAPGYLSSRNRHTPSTFAGLSTRFIEAESDHVRIRVAEGTERGLPMVWIGTIREFIQTYLHVDPFRRLGDLDWLLLPSQRLFGLAGGPIYRDDLGLARVRAKYRYFPRDVWLHLLSVQWLRISEEEAFVGRTGAVGDDLGARLLAARQVREVMRLEFLLERQYFPYDKWFGTAFRRLAGARPLAPWLGRVLDARTPRAREIALSKSYEILARQQNALRIARTLPSKVSNFHDRPYLVIQAGDFAAAIREKIRSNRIRQLTRIGSVDQFGSTEELGSHPEQLRSLRALLRS